MSTVHCVIIVSQDEELNNQLLVYWVVTDEAEYAEQYALAQHDQMWPNHLRVHYEVVRAPDWIQADLPSGHVPGEKYH